MAGQPLPVLRGTTHDVEAGYIDVFDGVLPATDYEARGFPYIPDVRGAWSTWEPATTPHTRLGMDDIDQQIADRLAQAEQDITDAAQAVVDANANAQAALDAIDGISAETIADIQAALDELRDLDPAAILAARQLALAALNDGWIKDPTFQAWNTAGTALIGTNWSTQTGGAYFSRATTGPYGSSLAQTPPSGTSRAHIHAASAQMRGADTDLEWVVLTAMLTVDAVEAGSGRLRLEWFNGSTWTPGHMLGLTSPTGTFGQHGLVAKPGVYQAREVLVQRPAGTFTDMRLWFGAKSLDGAAADVTWHLVQVRPATEAEIKSGQAAGQVSAAVNTLTTEIQGVGNALAAFQLLINTRVENVESNLTTNYLTKVGVNEAIALAGVDLSSAIGAKGKVIFSSTAPATADRIPHNLWIDTAGGANTPKRWNGTAWVKVSDKDATEALAATQAISANLVDNFYTRVATDEAIAAASLTLSGAIDTKGKVIFSSAAPAALDRQPQNLWIDTSGNLNTPKRWNGTAWVVVSDLSAVNALQTAITSDLTNNYLTKVSTNEAIAAAQLSMRSALLSSALPQDFSGGAGYWTTASAGSPAAVAALNAAWTFPTSPVCARVTIGAGNTANLLTRGVIQMGAAEVLRVSSRVTMAGGAGTGVQGLGFAVAWLDANYALIGSTATTARNAPPNASSDVSADFTAPAGTVYARYGVYGRGSAYTTPPVLSVLWLRGDNITSLKQSEATASSTFMTSAQTNTAISNYNLELNSVFGNLKSSVQIMGTTVATLDGFAAAAYRVEVKTGPNGARFEMIAPNGTPSAIRFDANDILFKGSVGMSHLTVTDPTNYVVDPNFTDLDSWSKTAGLTFSGGAPNVGWNTPALLQVNNPGATATRYFISQMVPIPSVRNLYASIKSRIVTGTGSLGIVLQGSPTLNPWVATTIFSLGSIPVGTSATVLENFQDNVPSGLQYMRLVIGIPSTVTSFYVANPEIRVRSGGKVIVDGALTARHASVTEEFLTASAQVRNAIIVNAHIAGAIQSTNYVAGVSGWRINKNGTAEFQDLVVRAWLRDGAVSDPFPASYTGPGTFTSDVIIFSRTITSAQIADGDALICTCKFELNTGGSTAPRVNFLYDYISGGTVVYTGSLGTGDRGNTGWGFIGLADVVAAAGYNVRIKLVGPRDGSCQVRNGYMKALVVKK